MLRIIQALSLCCFGIALFFYGQFPSLGLVKRQSDVSKQSRDTSGGVFDRLVFVVIDALRHDFAIGPKSHMAFLNRYITGSFK